MVEPVQGIPVTEGLMMQSGGESRAQHVLLSKSAFIAAYDCPVRLQHRRDGMASTKPEDEFDLSP